MSLQTRRAFVASPLALPLSREPRPAQSRPAAWARPVELAGVPNLHAVAPNIFRSAQPSAAGFRALSAQHGIKTVVSMRANHPDDALVRGTDIKVVPFPTNTWRIRRASVVGALRTVRTASRTAPVLLHCQHGADRTGLIIALYRVLYQGWTREAALDEMRNGDFGYHPVLGKHPAVHPARRRGAASGPVGSPSALASGRRRYHRGNGGREGLMKRLLMTPSRRSRWPASRLHSTRRRRRNPRRSSGPRSGRSSAGRQL